MRRVYTGLLIFGASVSAHAGGVADAVRSKGASANVSYRQVVPLAPETVLRNSVVFAKANDVLPEASSPTSVSHTVVAAEQKTDSVEELKQSYRSLANVLGALQSKRLRLEGEQLKLTLRPHAAEAEMRHVKLAMQADSTSITWSKSF